MTNNNRIFLALDTADLDEACGWVALLRDGLDGVKIGLELFAAHGADGVRTIASMGLPIFLDLKLHDIPTTVAKTIAVISRLPVDYLTIHAEGGDYMLCAAILESNKSNIKLLGVTSLTSSITPQAYTLSLVNRINQCHLYGIVCPGWCVSEVRRLYKNNMKIFVPGVRLENDVVYDQKCLTSPRDAIKNGADYIIVGRSITKAQYPLLALQDIANNIVSN